MPGICCFASMNWHTGETSVTLPGFGGSVARGWCSNPSKINSTCHALFLHCHFETQLQANSIFNWSQ